MQRQRPSQSQRRAPAAERLRFFGVCIVLIAIVWIVFGQTLHHEFVRYDDQSYVSERPEITGGLTLHGIGAAFTHRYVSNWVPLTAISHMLDCQLFGLKAGGHHFTNVFLHTIAVVLLFLVLREMTGTLWRSAFVAALFAIHPLHVESVAWVSERKDVLSAIFFMLTLGAYARYARKPSLPRYVTMSILFVCGLLSKSMVVTLPFVLLLLDYWPLQRIADLRSLRRVVLEKVPLFMIAAAACVATVLAQTNAISSLDNAPVSERIGNALVSILIYIQQTFWPVKLAAFYPHPLDRLPAGMVLLSIAMVLAISVVALVVGRRHKYIPVGWFWYLGMLVPVLGIVQVGLQAHADRYTYLPQIGLGLMIAWGIVDLAARWRYRPQVLGTVAALVIIALMWCARMQAAVWHDTETLWKHAIEVTDRNHLAYAGLAEIEMSRHEVDKAIAHFQTALEIYPDNFASHTKVGLLLLQTGNPSAAIAHWKIALEIEPHDFNTQCNLAWVFATCPNPVMRDGRRAVELMEDVIKRSGTRNAILLRTLAAAYAESGRFPEAIQTAQEALDLATKEGNTALAAQLRESIDNFEAKIPLRDPSLANAQPLREP
jgi:Flp pilus assembly protein TadD